MIEQNLHGGRSFSCSSNGRIKVDLAGSAMNLQKLVRIKLLETE
jgi:hypothetical protein